MRKVIFDSQPSTICINECHEEDGMIYVAVISGDVCMLFGESDCFKWYLLSDALQGVAVDKKFKTVADALKYKGASNVCQLSNLTELGNWLLSLND